MATTISGAVDEVKGAAGQLGLTIIGVAVVAVVIAIIALVIAVRSH